MAKIGNKIDPKTVIPKLKPKKFPIISIDEIEDNKRNIKYIAIHCAATKPSMIVDIDRIRGWHLKRGFNDVGYHKYIRRDGSVENGRDLKKTGAHVKNYNSVSIGICYEGGIDENGHAEDNRTPHQLMTMKRLIQELSDIYPKAKIRGHRDFPNVHKDCPSFDVKTWCAGLGIIHN